MDAVAHPALVLNGLVEGRSAQIEESGKIRREGKYSSTAIITLIMQLMSVPEIQPR